MSKKVVSKLPVEYVFANKLHFVFSVDAPREQYDEARASSGDQYWEDYTPKFNADVIIWQPDGTPFRWSSNVNVQDLAGEFDVRYKGFAKLGLLDCSCGVPGCAGVEDFLVEYTEDSVIWHIDRKMGAGMPQLSERIVFERTAYFAACAKFREFLRMFLSDIDAPSSDSWRFKDLIMSDESLFAYRTSQSAREDLQDLPLSQALVEGISGCFNQRYDNSEYIMYYRLHVLETAAQRATSVYGSATDLRKITKLLSAKMRLAWRPEHRAEMIKRLGVKSPKVPCYARDVLSEALALPGVADKVKTTEDLVAYLLSLTKKDVVGLAEILSKTLTKRPFEWRELELVDETDAENPVYIPESEVDWDARYDVLTKLLTANGTRQNKEDYTWWQMEHELMLYLPSLIKVIG